MNAVNACAVTGAAIGVAADHGGYELKE